MVRISQASQAVNASGEQIVEVSASSNVNVNDFTTHSLLGGTLTVDGSATTQPVSAVSLPLPSGAATAANQSTTHTLLSGTLTVDGSATTQPVSAVSLPLPSGAATDSNQISANGILTSIDSALAGTLTVDGSATTQPVSGTVAVSSISGTVATTTSAPSVSGTNNNHLSSQSVSSAYQSSGFDVSSASRFSIMGNTTDNSSSIIVEFSPDNTNWYRANTELYPSYSDFSSPYDFYTAFDGACVKYVRLNFANYAGTETVNATILTQ